VLRTALRALDREEAALDEILREKVSASMANKKRAFRPRPCFGAWRRGMPAR